MSVQKIIQESINENPLEMKEALAEELRNRVAEAISAKMEEEVEQIDELKRSTLASYVKKAGTDQYLKGQAVQYHTNKAQSADGPFSKETKAKHYDAADKALKKASNRDTGIGRAADRLAKD